MDVGLSLKFRKHGTQQNNFQKLETAWNGDHIRFKIIKRNCLHRIHSYPSSCHRSACKRRFDWAHPVHVEAHACCTTRLRCDKPPIKALRFVQMKASPAEIRQNPKVFANANISPKVIQPHLTCFQQHDIFSHGNFWKLILINFCVQTFTFEANFCDFGAPFWVSKNSANLGTSISVAGSKARP